MPTTHLFNSSSHTRPGATRARLIHALATLTEQRPMPSRVTAAELCRLAKVSRNSLYRYHAPIVAALRRHQSPKSARALARRSAERYRRKNAALRVQLAKITALVDHYFVAYRESATLLERRNRELAALRGNLSSDRTLPHIRAP